MKEYSKGSLVADGTEQALVEAVGVVELQGYVELSEMQGGDAVVIRQYMKLKTLSLYKKYAEDSYDGVQPQPCIFVKAKPSVYGVKVTLQQTAGLPRGFDYLWFVKG